VATFEAILEEVGEFLVVLGFQGMFKEGNVIQNLCSKLLNKIEQTMAKIW